MTVLRPSFLLTIRSGRKTRNILKILKFEEFVNAMPENITIRKSSKFQMLRR